MACGCMKGLGQDDAQQTPASWWSQRSDTEKWIVVGAATLSIVGLFTLLKGAADPSYAANLRASGGATRLPGASKRKQLRRSAPAKYRRLGAVHRADYAYPEGYAYPVVFHRGGKVNVRQSRKHVGAAKGYFTKHKHRYPMSVRKEIARNINRAARRLGMAADVRP